MVKVLLNLNVYLFHVVIECNPHAFFATEHLTGHECVEDSCAGQWEAEVEAKKPPVFYILVELKKETSTHNLYNISMFLQLSHTRNAALGQMHWNRAFTIPNKYCIINKVTDFSHKCGHRIDPVKTYSFV